jgi:hypothetical protein
MRWAAVVVLLLVLTGCGGERVARAKVETTTASRERCTHVSGGFRACTAFGNSRERSRIERRVMRRWTMFARPPRDRHGWWRRIVASRDGKTLLAQWSGECEIQSTYLVSTRNRKARPIFRDTSSTAVGWSEDGRARVRLPTPLYGTDKKIRFQAGIYLVEPVTLAISIERSIPQRHGC